MSTTTTQVADRLAMNLGVARAHAAARDLEQAGLLRPEGHTRVWAKRVVDPRGFAEPADELLRHVQRQVRYEVIERLLDEELAPTGPMRVERTAVRLDSHPEGPRERPLADGEAPLDDECLAVTVVVHGRPAAAA